MITAVTKDNISAAGLIHSLAWKQSHGFCSPEFIAAHTPQRQMAYLEREMSAGKTVYMLTDGEPVGIVSVFGSLIENLYVLPEKQNRGYGSRLLDFAISRCGDRPCLWVLSSNEGAIRLYTRRGFKRTGTEKRLNESLAEIEMVLEH